MATEVDNQEPTTETILHKTSSVAEPEKHLETMLKNYEAENIKDHVKGDNIDNLPPVDKASREKLVSSSSEHHTTVEICDTTEVSDNLNGKETEDQVSKSMGVKETESQLPKNSDERKIDGSQVEKNEQNFSQEIPLITEETASEGYREHNLETEEAEVHGSELTEENKVENFIVASIALDGTEKTTGIEHVTFEAHISRTSPEEELYHTISSGTAEKELHMASASEEVRSNPEAVELREDMKEEITNDEKIGCDSSEFVTPQSNFLSEPNKEEANKGEEMNACVGRALAVTPIEETCVTGLRSEAIESSTGNKEIVSPDGQSEKVEKARNTDINLPESPTEARKDETIDANSTEEKPHFHEKNYSAADINEEDEIHLYDTVKGQHFATPLVHGTEASEGTQLPVEEPKVMTDIDEEGRKLDSSDLRLPLTEEASDKDLAPPCSLETESNLDSKKELEIIETNTEHEEPNADSLVESRNLSIANDANSKVTKEETEFDSSSSTLSGEKRDELIVQESAQRKDTQMEEKSEVTDLKDAKDSDMNDNISQNSKPEEHKETDALDKEAEEIYSDITDKKHTTQSYSATLTAEESKGFNKTTSITEPDEHPESVLKLYEAENGKASNTESGDSANIDESSSVGNALIEKSLSSSSELNKATETDNGTEQISESLEGKEIQGQVLEGSNRKETECHATESSEGKETEGCDTKSSDGKETQDLHVEKGEWKSTKEIQTNTEEILGERSKGPNGGIVSEGTDVDIQAANSHQSEEVEVSELIGENNVENMTKAIELDNTEKITSVEPATFEDRLYTPSVEENSNQTISPSMAQKELYDPSAYEDPLANLEDIESRAMEKNINHEKIGHSDPVNGTFESDHVSNKNKEDMEKGEEMNSYLGSSLDATPIEQTCFTSSSEADVSNFGIKDIALLDEQSETKEKARNREINLPEVPTEAREDENIDASCAHKNQPFDGKTISADDLKDEDGTNQHDTTEGQLDAPPLVHETKVCEENQVSVEEPEETHAGDEADRMSRSSNVGLTPIEGASDMDMIHHYQIDADNAESMIDSTKELQIIAESNTKDKLQENGESLIELHNLDNDADRDSIKAETTYNSSSIIPTPKITDELNIQESEYREDSQMEEKSEAKGDLGDGKEEDTNNDINQNSELQGHGETDTFKEDTEIPNITDKGQSIQIYPATSTTEELKKTNDEAVGECENTKFDSPVEKEGTEDEPPASIREKSLQDSLATPEEVIKASIKEDKENGSHIKEEHCDQAIENTKFCEDEAKIEDLCGEYKEGKEENVVVSQENVDSTKPEEIMNLEKESNEENLGDTIHVEDTKAEALIEDEKSTVASSMPSPTGIVENEMLREEDKSIEKNPSSLPDEPKSKEEFSSTKKSAVAAITKEMEKNDCKENKMHDRDEEPDSLILKGSASEPTGSEPDEASKADESCIELSSISESDVKEHCDRPYLAEQASRTDKPCEELPAISTTDIGKHSDSSILETHVTHGSFRRMEDQGTKSVEDQIDKIPCENVEVTHENLTNESSQVPEEIEKNDCIIQTPIEIKEEGAFEELHSVSEPDIPSHEVKDIGTSSLQSIDTIDSNDKAEERPVPPAENPKTEEEPSITDAPEEMKEGKEQVQDMKSISLQNIEKKDSDEKTEERVIQLENSNSEQESFTTEVALETTGDEGHVQDMSIISLQNIDTRDLDEKAKERVLKLAENSNAEHESSTTEVLEETTGDKEHSQDMTNMVCEKSGETSSHNFMEDDDLNDNADMLVEKESSLKDVHIDEKTFNVYKTDMDNEFPLRINSSSKKDEQVEIRQLETASGSVYQTEPSETKEIISEMIKSGKTNLNEGSTDVESKYSVNSLSESIEVPNEQEDNTDISQDNLGGKEEIYGVIHGNSGNAEVSHISSQEKEEETNELQDTYVVQQTEEQERETLDSIEEKIHDGGVAVGVSSMISSEEKCLLKNDSNSLELRSSSVEGMRDWGRMEEENIYKEKSEETGVEMSSPDHNCVTSENSTNDVDNLSKSKGTVMIDELQDAADPKSDMLHAKVNSDTKKGAIKEESLQAEIGVVNIPKEERTETGSIEDKISREKVMDEGSSDLDTGSIEDHISRGEIKDEGSKDPEEAIPEEQQSITIEELSDTTKKENNNEKVTDHIDIIQGEKERGDDEYEKSFESNLQGQKRSIADDVSVTHLPGLNKVGENTELLAEGDKPAQGSSLETSEEIRKNIIYDETNGKNEDQVTFAANTSDLKVNEVTGQHSMTDEDNSQVQDPCSENLEEDCIDTKVQILDNTLPPLPKVSITNVLKDIEMMPESEKTTAQTETQKHQTADDSIAVAEATNLDRELKCTSDESKKIEQESTTIRPADEPNLDLTQGPTDNDSFASDKGESLAQLSEVHNDHAIITDEAEKEDKLVHESSNNIKSEIENSGNLAVSSDKDIEEGDPRESKPIISSKYKDIPLLESVSPTVTDIEEVKQVYPCEAMPEPNSTGSAEKGASHDHEETADSPMRASDLGHGFAEENIHETGDTDSQDQHGNHVVQPTSESSMRSQEGSIDEVESTHQTAEHMLATLSTSGSLSTPEAGRLMLSTPKDSKDDHQMQEKMEAADIRVRREILEGAESSFEESKEEGNRIRDEPEETTEKLLPAEMSEESTWEEAGHAGETSKLKTQHAGTEVKPEDAEVEIVEHNEQREGNSGSEVTSIGEKVPGETKDKSSTVYSNEVISVQEDPEECTDILINREGIEPKTDEAKVEEKEQDLHKENRSGSEVPIMGENDPGYDTSNKITTSQMECSSNMATNGIILSGGDSEDQVKTDETKVEIEKQDGWKEKKTISEAMRMSEEDADGHAIDTSIVAEMKDGTSRETPDGRISLQGNPEDQSEKTIYSEDKEIKTDQVEAAMVEQEVPKQSKAEVPLPSEKDPDNHTSKRMTMMEMKDGSPSTEPDYRTLVHEDPAKSTKTEIFSGDKEVKADGSAVDTGDHDVEKDEKLDSEVTVVGVTNAEIEKVMPVNTSEDVAQSERLDPSGEKSYSHDYQETKEASGSTLSSKISQTNQGQNSGEEPNLNPPKKESPTPECAEPENSNNETKERNNLPSEKETPVVEHFSVVHFSEAKKEAEQAENMVTKEDRKTIKNREDKDEEGKEHAEENSGSQLRVTTEASRDAEVKVSPKKSHNLFSGVIKHSISKMKKAITCTNSHPMPQSPK